MTTLRGLSAFKAVNSRMKAVTGVMKGTHVRVGSWFGKIDLRVIDMDDHSMMDHTNDGPRHELLILVINLKLFYER